MTWPNLDTTNESAAGALLLSNAVASGVTNAKSLSQIGLIQEIVSNLLVNPVPGAMVSPSATQGWGYSTGAGGLVTQSTNKTTAVALNKVCGQIVTSNAELLPGAEAKFVVTNSAVAATDVIIANVGGSATSGDYGVFAGNASAGAFDITLTNLSAVSLTEAVTINVAVLKAVNA